MASRSAKSARDPGTGLQGALKAVLASRGGAGTGGHQTTSIASGAPTSTPSGDIMGGVTKLKTPTSNVRG